MALVAKWQWTQNEATHDTLVKNEFNYVSRLNSERERERGRLMNHDFRHNDAHDMEQSPPIRTAFI